MYALFGVTTACILVLCSLPRSLAPVDVPPLELDRELVREAERADRKAAAAAPKTEAAKALHAQFLELGEIENQTSKQPTTPAQKRKALARAYDIVVRESDITGALALRSEAVEQLEAALRLQLSDAETQRVLGLFPDALERHAVTYEGIEIAPHFVMRTLYKARWNIAMGLLPDYRLAPVEMQAYHGWLALHATNLGPEPRLLALLQYAAAGGRHVAEARAALSFLSNDYKQAVASLEQAYQETPSLRLRNWLRGANVAVATIGDIPASAEQDGH